MGSPMILCRLPCPCPGALALNGCSLSAWVPVRHALRRERAASGTEHLATFPLRTIQLMHHKEKSAPLCISSSKTKSFIFKANLFLEANVEFEHWDYKSLNRWGLHHQWIQCSPYHIFSGPSGPSSPSSSPPAVACPWQGKPGAW